MKTYRVYELDNHRFTWAGGTIINVSLHSDDGLVIGSDVIEFYEVLDDKGVMELCLYWLEDQGCIEEAAIYIL
tara:strand:+ start:1023 stop:1241 length:219 start_codon:yes stop_codon:yes gene_type:complete